MDVFEKRNNDWSWTHDEIVDRANELSFDCPECENIIHSDEQYQCTTCGGGSKIYIIQWLKDNDYLLNVKP